MVDIEVLKDYLALYDEVYSHNKIVELTGFPSKEVTRIYHEMVMNHELAPRKARLLAKGRGGQILKIHPVTFDCTVFENVSQLRKEGYLSSNILNACKNKACTCYGHFWRFASEVDMTDIESSLKEQNPELFIPVMSIKDGVTTIYDSIQLAVEEGYPRQKIEGCIRGEIKSYKGCVWKRLDYEK